MKRHCQNVHLILYLVGFSYQLKLPDQWKITPEKHPYLQCNFLKIPNLPPACEGECFAPYNIKRFALRSCAPKCFRNTLEKPGDEPRSLRKSFSENLRNLIFRPSPFNFPCAGTNDSLLFRIKCHCQNVHLILYLVGFSDQLKLPDQWKITPRKHPYLQCTFWKCPTFLRPVKESASHHMILILFALRSCEPKCFRNTC